MQRCSRARRWIKKKKILLIKSSYDKFLNNHQMSIIYMIIFGVDKLYINDFYLNIFAVSETVILYKFVILSLI
jgi:hypothetical protein